MKKENPILLALLGITIVYFGIKASAPISHYAELEQLKQLREEARRSKSDALKAIRDLKLKGVSSSFMYGE